MIRDISRPDRRDRHVLAARRLGPPLAGHPPRIRARQQGHQHVRVKPRRPLTLGPPPRVNRRGTQMAVHRGGHQRHRMIRRRSLPRIRRQKKRPIPVDPPGPLRHSGNHRKTVLDHLDATPRAQTEPAKARWAVRFANTGRAPRPRPVPPVFGGPFSLRERHLLSSGSGTPTRPGRPRHRCRSRC